jgi:hypothetical protein
VQIAGADSATLKAAAEAVTTALAVYPEVSGLEDSMAYDREELSLELTPQGEALGFVIDDLGRVLRNRLGGIEAATFPDGPRTASIRVEVPDGRIDGGLPRPDAPAHDKRGLRAAGRYRDGDRAPGVFDDRPGKRRSPDLRHGAI